MIIIKSIWDLISLIIFIVPTNIICDLFNNKYNLLILYIIISIIEKSSKNITFNYFNNSITKRPNKACNCNIFNNGGICNDKSGFPSGHVAIISLYFNRLFLTNKNKTFKYFILYNIPCILMGFARYYKKCHNIYQIITGYILGLIVALINKYNFK